MNTTHCYELIESPQCKFWINEPVLPISSRVLILVHGISRNALHMLRSFSKAARDNQYTLIVPFFDRTQYPDYQRLGRYGRGNRADIALNKILDSWFEDSDHKVHLFGFSGGAQFAHRYALAHTERIRSITMTSAGWYTDLTSKKAFPKGINACASLPDLSFNVEALLHCPTYTLIGEKDTACKNNLRSSGELNSTQGITRLDRAKWFNQSLNKLCKQKNIPSQHRLEVLKNTCHEFGQGDVRADLVKKVISFCNEVENV